MVLDVAWCGLICYGDIQDMAVPGLAKKGQGTCNQGRYFFWSKGGSHHDTAWPSLTLNHSNTMPDPSGEWGQHQKLHESKVWASAGTYFSIRWHQLLLQPVATSDHNEDWSYRTSPHLDCPLPALVVPWVYWFTLVHCHSDTGHSAR